jgi:hypothetical protein
VEPVPDGHGEAREGLFVTALCLHHEVGIHPSSAWCAGSVRRIHHVWAAVGDK